MANAYRDPTLEAAHRLHEARKREERDAPMRKIRKRRRIKRLVAQVLAGKRR